MPDELPYDVIIVGGGIAGACALLRAAQNQLRTLCLLGDKRSAKGSRVKYIYNIDNMMGLHPDLMKEKYLSLFAKEPEIQERIRSARFHLETEYLVRQTIERVRSGFSGNVTLVQKAATAAKRVGSHFEINAGEEVFQASYVVLATGVADRQPVIRKKRGDKIVEGIQWVYPFANNESFLYCLRCEGHLTRQTNCSVIGYSEAAAQNALILHERYHIPVSLLTNGFPLEVEADTRRLLKAYGISVHQSPIADIKGALGGRVLHRLVLEDGTNVETSFALVAMGLYRVYNDLAIMLGMELEGTGPEETQHVLIDPAGESSVKNAFAIGDMTRRKDEPVMKQIYTAQEYAVRAIDLIDRRVRRRRREVVLSSSGE